MIIYIYYKKLGIQSISEVLFSYITLLNITWTLENLAASVNSRKEPEQDSLAIEI